MKDFYIGDCARHENKVITSTFVVVIKQIKPKKTGDPYLALTLGDRSGQIEAKMWDNVEEVLDAFEQDDFVKVKGLINKYKQRFQLTIHKLRKLGESEIEFSDYLPKTTKDIDELWRTLAGFVTTFQNPYPKGQLLGHMVIELEMLQSKLALVPGFPDELKTMVEHLIISHHGQYEFGSPKLPMFPEALMLHYLDDLDSKMEAMRAHFEREATLDGPWTSYNASLGRPLLNTQKFLSHKKEVPTEDIPASEPESGQSVEETPTLPSLNHRR